MADNSRKPLASRCRHYWPGNSGWHQAWLLANWKHRWNVQNWVGKVGEFVHLESKLLSYLSSGQMNGRALHGESVNQVGQHRDVSALPPWLRGVCVQVRRNAGSSEPGEFDSPQGLVMVWAVRSNELNNIVARNSDGVYEGVAIGKGLTSHGMLVNSYYRLLLASFQYLPTTCICRTHR